MNITDEALDEFIAIYKEEFGEEINWAEANEMASSLLTLYGRLARKLPLIKPTQPSDGHPPIDSELDLQLPNAVKNREQLSIFVHR